MPLSTGDKLGPYEILSAVGAGGMGEVWKARDTRLDRLVAIKRLKAAHSARFEQEARAIAALNHPHICQIHDIGEDYLVLEYIDGAPLKGPMPLESALRLATQIAQALEAAHAKGILHRDLKPGNILVTSNGAKLLDFGLAKLTADEDATLTMAVSGTLLYMSPEQAEGKPLDGRSDIFSFGTVLYELISGKHAFDSLGALLRDEPARLDSPAAEIVKRCMAKKAGERYQTMAEVREALEKLAAKPQEQQPSIAVLPFSNMSASKDDEYFSDGLSEEIINALAQVPGLKVIARTSAFAFRGKELDIRKIADSLGVTTVLEGSVRRAGSRVRITAQLITAADGSHLWSQRYDREMADIFAVQDEVAAAIAGVLQTKLAAKPATPHQYTPKLPAYEAYLKARYHQWKATPEHFERAKEHYEQAIALDPKFALAYVGYADFFLLNIVAGGPAPELLPLAREAARKAVAIDPSLPEANAMMGIACGAFEYDREEAERWFRLALAPTPVSPMVRLWHGLFYLAPIGRTKEAIEEYRLAVQQDPVSVIMRVCYAACLIAGGRFAEAEAQARQAWDIDPNSPMVYQSLILLLAWRGATVEALELAERAYALSPWFAVARVQLGAVLLQAGQKERAEKLLQETDQRNEAGLARAWVSFHLVNGDPQSAAASLIKGAGSRISAITFRMAQRLYPGPYWAPVAKRMNLPETPQE